MTPKLSYTRREAAAATGLSVDTITRAVNAGDLPARNVRVDGKRVSTVLILASDLEAWLRDEPRK